MLSGAHLQPILLQLLEALPGFGGFCGCDHTLPALHPESRREFSDHPAGDLSGLWSHVQKEAMRFRGVPLVHQSSHQQQGLEVDPLQKRSSCFRVSMNASAAAP